MAGEKISITVNIPVDLYADLQRCGFVKGSVLSTLSNEWATHKIREAVNEYIRMHR